MYNEPHVNENLLSAALKRAAKQFPEFNPQDVVASVENQHQEIMNARPVIQGPMRDFR